MTQNTDTSAHLPILHLRDGLIDRDRLRANIRGTIEACFQPKSWTVFLAVCALAERPGEVKRFIATASGSPDHRVTFGAETNSACISASD